MCISFYNNHAVQEASAERENNMSNVFLFLWSRKPPKATPACWKLIKNNVHLQKTQYKEKELFTADAGRYFRKVTVVLKRSYQDFKLLSCD